ncbi:zinc finger CCCH domain-containing protein 7A isoform X1 [Takifugu rubripes]|uniref:Zinc finger CCCH-type containing 7A n=2 Tax=Takifugu rubripes TaxID=31033 RepID=H2U6A7_TAKRU|nr:zinc finger CCCH domain-containing protein 7A isoform X1 [Takifugu rubripes]XP_011602433.1 zinc finger CCCH domain-containing protein 7A isoform X1 [Takifugu rubripes]XP_029692687.1 zinc finger CCCH domain-containing protein 7A isoform X1 [Takifugu rubripes]|eukprot:XP_003964899.2 PREDICTED: zinc finger CCCH domain-containing protein 7A isoform X1 [Takifugu rubripes]
MTLHNHSTADNTKESNNGPNAHGGKQVGAERAKMSGACQDRKGRWQEIQKGLQFIQSTLPFPGSQELYEVFIGDLVWNLFGEGNDVFREGDWTKSIEMYTEALSVAEYADSEEIYVPANLLEKLYANRAAAYLNIVPGLHDQALKDCEKALQFNEGNYKALYRKAKSLKEMGRHQEAYEAVAKCSLAVPQDSSVIQLTQDLAKILGLKIRKAYVRTKPALNVLQSSSYQDAACEKASHGSASVEEIEIDVPRQGQDGTKAPGPASVQPPLAEAGVEELPPPLPASNSIPSEPPGFESVSRPVSVPSPVSLPPFVNGCRHSQPRSVPQPSQDFDGDIIGDDLDKLLDQAEPEVAVGIPTMKGPLPLPTSITAGGSMPSSFLMPSHSSFSYSGSAQPCVTLPPPYHKSGSIGYFGMDKFVTVPQPLDSLDSLSITNFKRDYAAGPFALQFNSDIPTGMAVGMPEVKGLPAAADLAKNPLSETHEFRQACSLCFVKTGPGVLEYVLHTEEHKCKKDTLLGRMKVSPDKSWKLIRPRPTKTQYVGPYYICKEVAVGKECLYPGHCTFAYCQEEIDVWTLERKGFISRELLFDPYGHHSNARLTVPKILQEHHGIFMFLCEVCFDHKPRIISKTNKDDPSLCSHPVTKHNFELHKCLVHIFKENTVRYSKIRPLNPQCQLDVCRHEVRYGCGREDECFYAHSLIELKVWLLQHQQGTTHESIVQEAKKFWSTTMAMQGNQISGSQRRFGPPNLKMMFVCGQCWRNGQHSEADKNRKYCSAKARHTWAKDTRVVLVSSLGEGKWRKWTTVRPLPTKKPIPSQFEICMHVTAWKKCQYVGNCTFAHGVEERDLWTYMKENNIADMDQLYEQWLLSQRPGWGEESSSNSVRENGKQIHMPTDYAEEVAGNHCWLCGKNCNSEKQWQQHITSEKHKDRVFNSEDDHNCWQYRFPTGAFRVCERFLADTCTEDESCKLAHGEQELKEWRERREFLLMKLAKARKDHLIAPNDNDFGKYSFLLKDII